MSNQSNKIEKNGRIIIQRLAHHNPEREDFGDHVFYLFNYAFCIGCFAFLFGVVIALIFNNLFYFYIINFIDLSIIITFFIICWLPSLLQYSIQIIRKTALRNRLLKFIIRFLFPVGGIIFIFKSPLLGFPCMFAAGYFIIYIRRIKERILK